VAEGTRDEDVTGGVPAADEQAVVGPIAPPEPAQPEPAEPDALPSEDEIAAAAQDAYVRRAPKIGAFITVGALIGALVGLVAALVAGPGSPIRPDGSAFISVLDGQGSVRLLMALTGAAVGALVGGGLAARADRRSVRGRPEQPAAPRSARPGRRRPRG
jgi:hypothetical protein